MQRERKRNLRLLRIVLKGPRAQFKNDEDREKGKKGRKNHKKFMKLLVDTLTETDLSQVVRSIGRGGRKGNTSTYRFNSRDLGFLHSFLIAPFSFALFIYFYIFYQKIIINITNPLISVPFLSKIGFKAIAH